MGCSYPFRYLFGVSKTRAAITAILCFIGGFCVVPLGIDFDMVYLGLFAYGLIYGGVFCYKWSRDRDIKIKADQDLYNPLPQATEQVIRSNPESNRLMVPPTRRDV